MRTILAIDFDKNAAATYKANFPDTDVRSDPAIRTLIDLFCGGGIGAVGLHGRFWKWEK
jgi:site-specific DNA-cytosine methylase